MIIILVIVIVSSALLIGAAWGIFGKLGERFEGFLIALAGGALVLSLVTELLEPSTRESTILMSSLGVGTGALVFAAVDYLIDEKWGAESGGGLLAAITLDGIPENLALGVALIGTTPMQVAALAGSIFLSNLPEAAGGAREMAKGGKSRGQIFLLWFATAAILSAAAWLGNHLLVGTSEHFLAFIRCFAAGAVLASLATEVFPKAYKEDRHLAGVATAMGFLLAMVLGELGGA